MPPKTERKHFNDWPNTQGFDCRYEERKPVELQVEGKIPAYAAGVLFRTGLGPREFETSKKPFKVNHWFDQFSQVHRFQIHAPKNGEASVKVTYNSRVVCDELIEKIKKTGRLDGITFAAKYDPCVSFFQKMQSVFQTATQADDQGPSSANVGVTISPNFPGLSKTGSHVEKGFNNNSIETLCTKTDATALQMLDPETLEPRGVTNQKVLHPDLKGPMSGAHAKFDPVTGDVFNYNLQFGRVGTYKIFTVSASTGKTSILATIHHGAAYIHSIFLTEHYVILCVWNSFYTAGGAAMLWKQNILDAIAGYDETKPATWFVIDRKVGGRGHIATFESEAFFGFHSVNAYEEPSPSSPDSIDIIADIPVYPSLDVLKRFYIDNLLSDSPTALAWRDPANTSALPSLHRYRLPNIPRTSTSPTTPPTPVKTILEFTADPKLTPELPTINPLYATNRHRYIYGIVDTGQSAALSDSLIRYDVRTHETKTWRVHGHTPGEAIFVADPSASAPPDETAGVLLTVVLDGHAGTSYLLALDPRTMAEVGRARVPGAVGFGFHGTHVRAVGGRLDNWGG